MVPRTPETSPRTDQVGTMATLTTAGVLATVGAALVLILDGDVSPWWWIAVGIAYLLGVLALVATIRAALRRREAPTEEAAASGDADQPVQRQGPLMEPPAGTSSRQLPETFIAFEEWVAGLARRGAAEALKGGEGVATPSTGGATAATQGGTSDPGGSGER